MAARYPNLLEVRLIPAKKDIAFVEYADEESATVAKEALHNFKIDGETKMKVSTPVVMRNSPTALLKGLASVLGIVRKEVDGIYRVVVVWNGMRKDSSMSDI